MQKVVVLTGAGISAESGTPNFRGEGGLWSNFDATELATPGAFAENPSLVWEFYHYRRTIVAVAARNAGHYAVAALQRRCRRQGKDFILLTQDTMALPPHYTSTGFKATGHRLTTALANPQLCNKFGNLEAPLNWGRETCSKETDTRGAADSFNDKRKKS
uniref:Deacetylase sirtuin-type domain-containing protein n=1 Tax=Physcomitrium patens TaxID=3218 RepID=A0A2K1IGC4_PHYPA|nr:NAD-dependent protein deacylase-like [Physcomitrium patens]PNR28324.1 hypothetical protein PHYPA_028916 [Physcomitrium patens]|eukprot:XP_024364573.1 NAD-dependent protein deacylase-like [Physcomitrella patens]